MKEYVLEFGPYTGRPISAAPAQWLGQYLARADRLTPAESEINPPLSYHVQAEIDRRERVKIETIVDRRMVELKRQLFDYVDNVLQGGSEVE